ncbi:MAG: redox-regulated ATPase YchF [Candidatus Aenigmatarchaeota archaeon]
MLVGIVGKPSCGKSTFFKAATSIDVPIAAYPFTTIKPNHGIGFVRVQCVDREFGVQCNPRLGYCKNGTRFVPVELMDVAGLVPGAHEGKGLGNQFLNDLNRADVLIHVVDASGTIDEKGEATAGYDPSNDVRFLEEELDMWYLGILKKGWEKFARQVEATRTKIEDALAKQLSAFRVTEPLVTEAITRHKLDRTKPHLWTEEQMKQLAVDLRRATKPILIACNKIDLPGAYENYERLKKEFPHYVMVPCSGDSEIALKEAAKKGLIDYTSGDGDFKILKSDALNEKQKSALEYIRKNVLKKCGSTGVQQTLDIAVFQFLKYMAVFPGGVSKLTDREGRVLPDCFLLPPGSTAIDFAGKIHQDFAKNFLFAIDVRTKMRLGKEHPLKHRDVIEIVSAAK